MILKTKLKKVRGSWKCQYLNRNKIEGRLQLYEVISRTLVEMHGQGIAQGTLLSACTTMVNIVWKNFET
jgi:hypothetical protein